MLILQTMKKKIVQLFSGVLVGYYRIVVEATVEVSNVLFKNIRGTGASKRGHRVKLQHVCTLPCSGGAAGTACAIPQSAGPTNTY
jgi:hypothetical protein